MQYLPMTFWLEYLFLEFLFIGFISSSPLIAFNILLANILCLALIFSHSRIGPLHLSVLGTKLISLFIPT